MFFAIPIFLVRFPSLRFTNSGLSWGRSVWQWKKICRLERGSPSQGKHSTSHVLKVTTAPLQCPLRLTRVCFSVCAIHILWYMQRGWGSVSLNTHYRANEEIMPVTWKCHLERWELLPPWGFLLDWFLKRQGILIATSKRTSRMDSGSP